MGILAELPTPEITNPLRWRFLPWDKSVSERARKLAMRLNALADPYFFGKVILGYDRLVQHLHGPWLQTLSDPNLHMVFEAPRDHFKTTCGTVVLSIWWTLPFEEREENWCRGLGYGEEWIRYMKRIHSRNLRVLIASETEPNAVMMGFRFDHQYEKNKTFRDTFSDLLPPTGSVWNQLTKTHNRTQSSGEGTFNFVGVGTVLQSRHLDRAIEDDLFGEEALYSESSRKATIEWHQRLPGAFDTDVQSEGYINLELVTGNRWGLNDLNGWIRENNPQFRFETHSAEGGCCARHPAGQPIFPEEFTMERLAQLRVRFGIRSYSAHYLNQPVTEEECSFRVKWLRRYRLDKKPMGIKQDGSPVERTYIERLPASANEVLEDIALSDLKRILILDPNHGGEKGRARHAAVVVGYRKHAGKNEIYLLQSWAKAISHDQMAGQVKKMAERWHVERVFVETIAGQDGWLLYFERELRSSLPQTFVESCPKERGAGAKERRILSMSPLYERGQVWVRNSGDGVEDFLHEYEYHPNGTTVDLIDAMGYLFNIVETQQIDSGMWQRQFNRDMEQRKRSVGKCGY